MGLGGRVDGRVGEAAIPRVVGGHIAGTDTDLAEAQRSHNFREDLYSQAIGIALRVDPVAGGNDGAGRPGAGM